MAPDPMALPDDIERIRQRKMERYRRVASLAKEGGSFPREPLEAGVEEAEAILRRFPVACLEFWAQWCAPCLRMRPVVDEVAAQFWGDVAFVRVSLDEAPGARDRWGVTVLPTIIITRGGLEAARQQGALTRRKLEEFVAPFAGGPPGSKGARPSSAPPGRVGGR